MYLSIGHFRLMIEFCVTIWWCWWWWWWHCHTRN